MENNYFMSALKNYIDAQPNEKECYYMDSNTVNYATLCNFIFTDMILCNNIVNNYEDWELELGDDYDEENGEYLEFYQYFIVDYDSWRLDQYKEYLKDTKKESDITIWYDNKLDIYILGVSHWGTSWRYVPTEIEVDCNDNNN